MPRCFLQALLLSLAISLVACGDASTTSSVDVTTTYVQRCAGCHGAIGSDQFETSLPSQSELDATAIETKIRFGGTQMPGFAGSLTDEEISAIAELVAAR